MLSRLLLTAGLISAVVVLQSTTSTSTGTGKYQSSQWDQYIAQGCDRANDPSTCKPG